jgi:hypothetical protein
MSLCARMPLYQRVSISSESPELRMSAQPNTAKRKRVKWGTSKKSLNTPPFETSLSCWVVPHREEAKRNEQGVRT